MFFYSSYETTFTKVVQNIFEVNITPYVIEVFFPSYGFSLQMFWKQKLLRAFLKNFVRQSQKAFMIILLSTGTLSSYHRPLPPAHYGPKYPFRSGKNTNIYILQISIFTFGKTLRVSHNIILHPFAAASRLPYSFVRNLVFANFFGFNVIIKEAIFLCLTSFQID